MRRLNKQIKQTAQNVAHDVRQAFRGVLNLIKSADEIQKTQVSALADETLQDVEFMQQFGFTSVPPAGTQAVIIPVGGRTTHGIVIATENGAYRIKALKDGEVAIYDQSGSSITLKQGRIIEVDCDQFNVNCKTYQVTAATSAKFDTPTLETSQVLTAQGQINGNGGMAVQGGNGATFSGNVTQTGGDLTSNGVSLQNHTHLEQGDGKETSKPIK